MPTDGKELSPFAETALPHRDPQRLGALLGALEPRLAAVAVRFTRDPETARDVVQNAFEKVIRHGKKFRGRSRLSTWIHRIVTNEALMRLRSERRRGEVQLDAEALDVEAVADPAPGPEEEVARRENEALLRDEIARLSSEEREVVMGCALGEMSYAEYGARTRTHPAALKSRAFRARRRLRALLVG